MLSPTLALRCPHCQHALSLADLRDAADCPACRQPHGLPPAVADALALYERAIQQAVSDLVHSAPVPKVSPEPDLEAPPPSPRLHARHQPGPSARLLAAPVPPTTLLSIGPAPPPAVPAPVRPVLRDSTSPLAAPEPGDTLQGPAPAAGPTPAAAPCRPSWPRAWPPTATTPRRSRPRCPCPSTHLSPRTAYLSPRTPDSNLPYRTAGTSTSRTRHLHLSPRTVGIHLSSRTASARHLSLRTDRRPRSPRSPPASTPPRCPAPCPPRASRHLASGQPRPRPGRAHDRQRHPPGRRGEPVELLAPGHPLQPLRRQPQHALRHGGLAAPPGGLAEAPLVVAAVREPADRPPSPATQELIAAVRSFLPDRRDAAGPEPEGRIPASALAVARRALLARHADERRQQQVRDGGLGLLFAAIVCGGLLLFGLWYVAAPIAVLAVLLRLRREERGERFGAEVQRLGDALGGQRLPSYDAIAAWFDRLWPAPVSPEAMWTSHLHGAVRCDVHGYPALVDVHLNEKTAGGVVYPPRITAYLAALWPGRVPSLRITATDLTPAAQARLARLRKAGYTVVADAHGGLIMRASESIAQAARADITRLPALQVPIGELADLARDLGAEPVPAP
ncbi:hypothetical protein [Nannocystis pusilla]|uniref:hypothetical protein n=1 Tax=Nannocystis pusilla TaxID=889268 RepID=UPI003B76C93B